MARFKGASPVAIKTGGAERGDLSGLRWGGGAVRIIACIEEAEVIDMILTHLQAKVAEPEATRRSPCRAPPQAGLFD